MNTAETLTAASSIDARELRRCLGQFVTGVTVVTTSDANGGLVGLTANSFSSVSLDPPLILWSQRLQAASHPAFRDADRFAINILASSQVEVSNRFGSPAGKRFEGLAITRGLGDVPLINGCAAYLECRKEAMYPGGDHVIFVGRVERLVVSGTAPLAFGQGKYMVVQPHDLGSLTGDLGLPFAPSVEAVGLAQPLLEQFSKEHQLTACLAVWGNHGPTIVRWTIPSEPLDVPLRSGLVLPVLSSAGGVAFAAHLPRPVVAPYIDQELATARRGQQYHTPQTKEEVEAVLEQVRRAGVATATDLRSSDAQVRGIDAVSAPIFDGQGHMVMALTAMGYSDDIDCRPDGTLVQRLREQAGRISAAMAHQGM
jgi:flavin reductase (DIM6/NTAB) family NADH-FMN oxidoreductase RutF/DNA-binding IclR family transcriptional regulator